MYYNRELKNLNTNFHQNTYHRFYRPSPKLNIRPKTPVASSQANLLEMPTSLEEKAATAVVVPCNVSDNTSIKLEKISGLFQADNDTSSFLKAISQIDILNV
jgi:hypothetical protein